MRLCVMIEGQEGVTWDDWLALARACEENGYEALFRSDHYGPVVGADERGSLDAWTTLAGLAAVTSALRLGTLVSPATFRHPSVLAKSAVTVDQISGGRVEVGIGRGLEPRRSTSTTASRSRRRASAWTSSPSSSRWFTGNGRASRSRSRVSTTGSPTPTHTRSPSSRRIRR